MTYPPLGIKSPRKVPKVISIAAVDYTKLALHGAESFAVDSKGIRGPWEET